MYHTLLRPAVAMLELIFSIVIMGIVLMSAPMLISTASSSVNVALQQEGINEAASRINMILTYAWDQNDTNNSCIPPVLHVVSGDSELEGVINTKRRIGVPLNSNSRTFKCGNNEFNASAISTDGADDIDDFSKTTTLVLNTSGGTEGKDYIEQTTVNIATTVSYINDTASYGNTLVTYVPGAQTGSSSNIKQIQVVLSSTSSVNELNKTITLNAFSCNVGGFEYESKVMP